MKNFKKNSKEIKLVYNYILNQIKEIQSYYEEKKEYCVDSSIILDYDYMNRCGVHTFCFLFYTKDTNFFQKLFEYDAENLNILESYRWAYNRNEEYVFELKDLITDIDINLKKK